MNPWYPKIVNASDLDYVPMTPRVEAAVNHPAFQRLGEERQLGLLDRVYPTATHTRANHSLGIFLGVCLYLEALYRDPDVPTFKVTIEIEDLRRAMVAALIHDLGQTALGHDLEEADQDRFDHKKFVSRIVNDEFFKDASGRTLRDVIEGQGPDCWSVSLPSVMGILDGNSRRPIDGVLTDCISGTIDADKLDYLIRDSVDCRVSYGKGIDVRRFLRSLTMTVTAGESSRESRAVLSVRRKGFAAMQALALTRYEMHCALYWHHTFRALKSMILDAAARCLVRWPQQGTLFPIDVDKLYYDFVVCGKPWQDAYQRPTGTGEKSRKVPKNLEEDNSRFAESPPRAVNRHRAIEMLWRFGDDPSRRLLEAAVEPGQLYRRIFERSVDQFSEQQRMKFREMFMGAGRVKTRKAVHESLHNALIRAAQMRAESVSFRPDEVLAELSDFEKDESNVTIDCPLRGWLAEGRIPFVLADYKRKFFEPSMSEREQNREFWERILFSLMREAAFFRVFCSPELHGHVTRLLDAEGVEAAVRDAIPSLFN